MKYILDKCSSPGWSKEFDSEFDARQELLSHICNTCLAGDFTYIGEGGTFITESWDEPAPDQNNIHDLLSTACGCEFGYEEVE